MAPRDPAFLEAGIRYIALISTTNPKFNYAIAIDEAGVVFDPDKNNMHVPQGVD